MKSLKTSKVGLIVFVLLVIVGAGFAFRKPKASLTEVTMGQAERKDLVQRVTIAGRVVSKKTLIVKPSFSGYVQKVFVKIGDTVKAGDPLVTFSPSLGASESNYPVRAAFSGRVTQVLKNEGEYVTESSDSGIVLKVEDLTQLYVLANVPELDIAKVKLGQKTVIKISSLVGETFAGEISEIALSAQDKERWSSSSTDFQVRIQITSKTGQILPGMSALCDVVTNRADKVLVLGHEYVQQDDDGNYYVTDAQGQRKKLTLGLQTEEGVEVKSGLSEGEKVRVIDFLNMPKLQD